MGDTGNTALDAESNHSLSSRDSLVSAENPKTYQQDEEAQLGGDRPVDRVPSNAPSGESNTLSRLNSRILANGMPYTILTSTERRVISLSLVLMGLSGSLCIAIYWVALVEIERAFHITEEQVNLTITVYLIFQALSPLPVCNLADYFGRRPVQIVCMTGTVGTCVGIAVCNKYWVLMLMRCLMACFVSPAYNINSAVVGDITTGRDRGGLNSFVGGCALIGQGLAPFLGSLVDSRWGWRAIFWFSAAFNLLTLIVTLLILPETKRSIVGNMSHRPEKWVHWSPALLYLGKRLDDKEGLSVEPALPYASNPFEPFKLLKHKAVAATLFPCALIYSCWTMSQASLSVELVNIYHYRTLQVGLCFFAPGIASIIATLASGKILNWQYRKRKSKYIKYWEDQPREKREERKPFDFLRARMSFFPLGSLPTLIFTFVFGWTLRYHVNVAAVLVSSFILTGGSMLPVNISMTMMVDLFPEKSGVAVALANMIRASVAAVFVSCLTLMNAKMTLGGTYTLISGMSTILVLYVCWVLWRDPHRSLLEWNK